MPTLKTVSGKVVHPIGIGTWNIGSRWDMAEKKVYPVRGNEGEEIDALRYSLSRGQNHIDGAEMYGDGYTDEIIGRAIIGAAREDLYIADKVKQHVATGTVAPAVKAMLRKLGTDYLDMLYIHWPDPAQPWQEAIPQINDLIDAGVVRQFGVSNFNMAQMQETISASKHPIAANQMRYNVLYKDEVTSEFREFCAQYDITIVAYRPVERQAVLDNPVVLEVAKAHQATPAQVALAWLLSRDALPIPKAVTKAHIDENLGALKLKLTADDLRQLDKL